MNSKDQTLLEEAYLSIMESSHLIERDDRYQKHIKAIKASGLKLVGLGAKHKFWNNEELMIANDSGRSIILIDLGVIKLPFYRSTGDGRKERVQANKWYPIFGIGSNGWFNKGSQSQINNYYGSNLLKRTAQLLDRAIDENEDCGWNLGMLSPASKESIKRIINKDLSPSTEKNKEFFANVANILSKVEGIFRIKLKGSKGEIEGNLPFLVGRSVIKRAVGEESRFFAEPQFELFKSKFFDEVPWAIRHFPEARNTTLVNGKEIPTNGQLLRYGDIITLGKSETGKLIVDV